MQQSDFLPFNTSSTLQVHITQADIQLYWRTQHEAEPVKTKWALHRAHRRNNANHGDSDQSICTPASTVRVDHSQTLFMPSRYNLRTIPKILMPTS